MSNTPTITVEMTPAMAKKFEAFLAAEKVVESIKKGLKEFTDSQNNGNPLRSALDLANDL